MPKLFDEYTADNYSVAEDKKFVQNVFTRSVALENALTRAQELLMAIFSPGTSRGDLMKLQEVFTDLNRLNVIDPELIGDAHRKMINTLQGTAEGFREELIPAGRAKLNVKKAISEYKDAALELIKESKPTRKQDEDNLFHADPSEMVAKFKEAERKLMAKIAAQGIVMTTAPMLPILSMDKAKMHAANLPFQDFMGYTVFPDQPVFGVSMDYMDKQLATEGTDVSKLTEKNKKAAHAEYLKEALDLYRRRHPGTEQLGPTIYYRGCAFCWMPQSRFISLVQRATFGGHLSITNLSFAFSNESRPPIRHLGR